MQTPAEPRIEEPDDSEDAAKNCYPAPAPSNDECVKVGDSCDEGESEDDDEPPRKLDSRCMSYMLMMLSGLTKQKDWTRAKLKKLLQTI